MNTEQTIVSPEIKLEAWGDGPWVHEPDYVAFEYRGYHCEIRRMLNLGGRSLAQLLKEGDEMRKIASNNPLLGHIPVGLGHLCGYLSLAKGHPWHGIDYDDIDANIHGGITYGEGCEDGAYQIGFDCAHAGDVIPGMQSFVKSDPFIAKYKLKMPDSPLWDETYKTIEFVKRGLEYLVDQAIEAEKCAPACRHEKEEV